MSNRTYCNCWSTLVYSRQQGDFGFKKQLFLFERYHRCSVNVFYRMSNFTVSKVIDVSMCWPYNFSIRTLGNSLFLVAGLSKNWSNEVFAQQSFHLIRMMKLSDANFTSNAKCRFDSITTIRKNIHPLAMIE